MTYLILAPCLQADIESNVAQGIDDELFLLEGSESVGAYRDRVGAGNEAERCCKDRRKKQCAWYQRQ